MLDPRRIGRQIKHFRELAGLSKSELARRVGVSPTAVNNWEENGVMPRMEVTHALGEALEVSFMQLMTGDDSPQVQPAQAAPSPGQPEVSRGERLDQFRRQIAALFEVAPDRVEITIRT
ncbi:MAG TPA: helix-turn-helix transcriptional regulator [Sphingomicrobium sp.]|jgi:transcriptional regulator with XRE-family HTH domain|nr:helix-turn-helix transcriptional regulator [Sphingomicrobium sp.]